MVPGGVVEVDEADAALDETASKQAVERELVELPLAAAAAGLDRRLVAVQAIGVERLFRLAGQRDQLGRGGLHAEGQLVGGDATVDLRVLDLGVAEAVEVAQIGRASCRERG